MKPSPAFWPREPAFWGLHGSALLFIVVVTLASYAVWGHLDAALLWRTSVWPLPYTLAVLGWRWLSERREWGRRRLPMLILAVLLYSTLSGTAVIAAVELPLQAFGLVPPQEPRALLRAVLSGGLQAQLFIAAWAFVHIGHSQRLQARDAELVALRLDRDLREAQMRALVQQLNPHFLFNALNNLRFLVHEDAAQAEGAVVALSGLLRQALQSSEQAKVPLSQELSLVRQQLALHRLQMEQRLQEQLQIEAGLDQALLPPLTLQLLVENAIKHGLEPRPDGGLLTLRVRTQDARLRLSLSNPCASGAAPAAGLGLGLRNLQQRLELLYAGRARLGVRHGATLFEVEIDLPLEFGP